MVVAPNDRIADEAGRIEAAARQIVALRATRTPAGTKRAKSQKGQKRAAAALGKIAARLESVRVIMLATVEDLTAASGPAASTEG